MVLVRKRAATLAIGLMVGWTLLACNTLLPVTPTPTPAPTEVVTCNANIRVYASQKGQTITLQRGDTLSITLDENRSTGFMWQVETIDPEILSAGEQIPFGYGSLPGSSGQVELCFKAVGVGTTQLALAYKRSWETQPANSTFDLTVAVGP